MNPTNIIFDGPPFRRTWNTGWMGSRYRASQDPGRMKKSQANPQSKQQSSFPLIKPEGNIFLVPLHRFAEMGSKRKARARLGRLTDKSARSITPTPSSGSSKRPLRKRMPFWKSCDGTAAENSKS
ncbi:uncharacterized protein LOC134215136 [Armigeres subalbatus]|uniref:uncharacterized protein LOC134215136 n=1 Tax=Armigeres subalbatus TaxID=124917 RepID=UPI002ED53013